MTNNEEFEFSYDPTEKEFADGFKAVGIDPANMKLALYFIPIEKTDVDDKK
jgi:hypothetical protein